MTFLDTNVILRYLTGDDARKAQRCEALLLRAERGQETLYTTALAIAEVVWVLVSTYAYPKGRVVEKVGQFLHTYHIHLDELDVVLAALQFFERHPIDFIDAYHAAMMMARGVDTIYSYDHDFDRLPDLKRLEP